MKKSKRIEQKPISRVRELNGPPLPATIVKKAIDDFLVAEIESRIRRLNAQRERNKEASAQIVAPIRRLIEADAEAMQALQNRTRKFHEQIRAFKGLKPPLAVKSLPKSEMKTGSLLTFAIPAYNFTWEDGSGWGDFEATGGGETENGEGRFQATFGSGEKFQWGGAGLATFLRPIAADVFVRFSAFIKLAFSWRYNANFAPWSSNGFIGLYVQSFDLNGGNARVEADSRSPLFSYGGDWTSNGSGGDDDEERTLSRWVEFSTTNGRVYVLWVWGEVYGAGWGGDNSPFQSYARADLSVSVPFMTVTQFT